MLFNDFCNYLQQIEGISSRNEITIVLSNLFKKLEKSELPAAIYLLQGRVSPPYIDLEFNFSTKLLIRSLADTEVDLHKILEEYSILGDIGLLLERHAYSKGGELRVEEVYDYLLSIANVSGKDSQFKKSKLSQEIISKMNPVEAKFYARIILGKLRLGVSDKTIFEGLSWAVNGDKSLKPQLEKAYGARADLPSIAESLLYNGPEALLSFRLQVGTPVSSKLVEREKSSEKIFERLGKGMIVQPKYDGLRMQIHFSENGFDDEFGTALEETGEKVRLFSRNMSNITSMFPDVVEAVQSLKVKNIILDSEAIGIDPLTGRFMPFQDTIQRKRKYGVTNKVLEIPVKVFCFDILYLNDESLLDIPLRDRLKMMSEEVSPPRSEIILETESANISSLEELKMKFGEYKSAGLEGLIAKSPLGIYEPGTRNYEWIKQKVKAQDTMADSIDAVVLGYYRGEGVRTKYGIGGILVGLYDPLNDTYQSLAKVGTGFKDEDLILIKKNIDELAIPTLPVNVRIDKTLIPDILCRPELVVVVEADQVSKSKLHGSGDFRFSLRFPRFKYLRFDKKANQATTVQEAKKLNELN